MKPTEVFKELLKTKVNAKLSHYCSGNLYYTVQLEDGGLYQFPIETIEKVTVKDKPEVELPFIKLSSGLGTTQFDSEIKASFLNRWITKAIEKGEFIKIN